MRQEIIVSGYLKGWKLTGVIDIVSGGFAVMNPNSVLSINAVEGFPLEDFSIEAVRSQLTEAQKVASGNGSATEIAEANIEIEVSRAIHTIQPANLQQLEELDTETLC